MFKESDHPRDRLGRFASKNAEHVTTASKVVATKAGSTIGGVAGAKIAKIASNLITKKLTGQKTSVVAEVRDVAEEISGKEIGQFVGHLVGGHAGGAIGGYLGTIAKEGIKHVRKVAMDELDRLDKDEAFKEAGNLEKTKMLVKAVGKKLKETSGEHRKKIRESLLEDIGGNFASSIIGDNLAGDIGSEYATPDTLKRGAKKTRSLAQVSPQKNISIKILMTKYSKLDPSKKKLADILERMLSRGGYKVSQWDDIVSENGIIAAGFSGSFNGEPEKNYAFTMSQQDDKYVVGEI